MTIKLIHVSDIHFGSGEVHGRLNPLTGLNVRFEDFTAAFAKVVDFAVRENVDVFLFAGDAYKNASPEPLYQKMFARELKRLSDANIKTILLVGNHDQILRSSQSHAMSVFQSLAVPGVLTIDQPLCRKVETDHGALQLIGLPHVTRHHLMTIERYASLTPQEIDSVLVEHVAHLLRGFYDDLDPALPAVVTAHMTVDRAVAGIEQELLVGYTLTFPSDIFISEKVDYVALGHVHKQQVIRPCSPAIVYCGSLERVDFGEEREDKGFMYVRLDRGKVEYEFHSINPRPFLTIEADLTGKASPTEELCELITKKLVPGCVLRIRYRIRQDQLGQISEAKIRNAAAAALSIRITPEIIPEEHRGRLPQLGESAAASPLYALETYLAEVYSDKKERLLERARHLMEQMSSCEH